MTTLQEQFEKDFPDKGEREINASNKYGNANFTNWDLDLREYVNLERLNLSSNRITSIDLSENSRLIKILSVNNPLTSLKLPPGWKEKIWTKIRDNTNPKIPKLIKLIDTSDLDNWVANYDESKVGDVEYHEFCGGGGEELKEFKLLDDRTLDNLGNKVIARKLIVLSRLLTPTKDLPKNKDYEEKMNELAEGWQMCGAMNLPGRTPNNPWTIEEQQEAVNKALQGDIELLSKLQDLPYLYPDYKLTSENMKIIQELTQENQNLKTQLATNKQELEKQLQEKDQALTKLTQTHQDQIKELQTKITELEQQLATAQKEITNWKTKHEKAIQFIKEIREEIAKDLKHE